MKQTLVNNSNKLDVQQNLSTDLIGAAPRNARANVQTDAPKSKESKPSFSDLLSQTPKTTAKTSTPNDLAKPQLQTQAPKDTKPSTPIAQKPKLNDSDVRTAPAPTRDTTPDRPIVANKNDYKSKDIATADKQNAIPMNIDDESDSPKPIAAPIEIPVEVTEAASTLSSMKSKIDNPNLQILSTALGKKSADSLFNQNPILSFVSGKLDKIEPTSIPSLISENPFLKDALAASNLSKFFDTPKSIDQLFKDLEIDSNLITKSSQMGIDLTEKVSARDFLTALGLDPNRAQVELDLLSQKLPVEGVAAFVKRAQALGKPSNSKNIPAEPQVNLQSDDKDKKADDTLAINPMMLGAHLAAQQPQMDQMKPQKESLAPEKSSAIRPRDPVSTTTNIKDLAAPGLLDVSAMQMTQPQVSTEQMSQPLTVSESKPKIAKSETIAEDPFEMIAKDRAWNLQSFANTPKANENVTAAPIQDRLLEASINKNIVNDRSDLFADKKVDFKPENLDLGKIDLSATQSKNPDAQLNMSVDPSSSVLGRDVSSKKDFGSSSDFMSGQSDKDSRSSELADAKPTAIEGKMHRFEIAHNKAPTETSQAEFKPVDVKKIMDQAHSMVQKGGGSMRIDLSDANIGKLDLAVRVNHDQVEIRILTDHSNLRDILNSEMPRLRDSLLNQGLNLKTVEVSVGDRNTWSQSFQQNQNREFHEGARDFLAATRNASSDFGGSRRTSENLSTLIPRRIAPTVGEGRISVRI